jgi:transposase-like protein
MSDPKPKTLQEAVKYFSDPDNCLKWLVAKRWPDGVVRCPHCGRNDATFLPNLRKWQCKSAHGSRQFSAKVGTIFEDSPLPLEKWLVALWMVCNCKNGVSSWEIHRTIGVTQKTAWFMLHRIRKGLQDESAGKLGGEVEVDETFIGGKARNMHIDKRERRITGTGGKDKAIVFGALERGGKVRTAVVTDRKKAGLQAQVRSHVKAGAAPLLRCTALLRWIGSGICASSH